MNTMAHDVAKAIVFEAQKCFDEARLNVTLELCKDRDFSEVVDPQQKTCCSFYNVVFESSQVIGRFSFSLNNNKHFFYKNFEFRDYEVALNMFLYQHVMHALYAEDLMDYEIVVLSLCEEKMENDNNKGLQFCLHLNLSDIPSVEVDSITSEILDKISEPIRMVFDSWRQKYNKN